MRTLAITESIRTVTPSAISLPRVRETKQDPSLEGVLVFSGISVALAALSVIFGALHLPSAFLF